MRVRRPRFIVPIRLRFEHLRVDYARESMRHRAGADPSEEENNSQQSCGTQPHAFFQNDETRHTRCTKFRLRRFPNVHARYPGA